MWLPMTAIILFKKIIIPNDNFGIKHIAQAPDQDSLSL